MAPATRATRATSETTRPSAGSPPLRWVSAALCRGPRRSGGDRSTRPLPQRVYHRSALSDLSRPRHSSLAADSSSLACTALGVRVLEYNAGVLAARHMSRTRRKRLRYASDTSKSLRTKAHSHQVPCPASQMRARPLPSVLLDASSARLPGQLKISGLGRRGAELHIVRRLHSADKALARRQRLLAALEGAPSKTS